MQNDIQELRTHLFDTLRGLKDGTMEIDKARAVSQLADTIIDTAKVEVDFLRANGSVETSFFAKPVPGQPRLGHQEVPDHEGDLQEPQSREIGSGVVTLDHRNGQRVIRHQSK